jgi:hypothetical protein
MDLQNKKRLKMISIRIHDRDLRYYADGEDAFSMRRTLVPTTKVCLKKRITKL